MRAIKGGAISIKNNERELKKINDDLLKGCRLTQEVISKTSGVLISFDAQKIQEIIDQNKKIVELCASSCIYLNNIIKEYQPEDYDLVFINSAIKVYFELKQVAKLTTGIAECILILKTDIPERHRINISQFAKIFQNIVWDSVVSFLKKDSELAKKVISASQELKIICYRMLEETERTSDSPPNDEKINLLCIIQSMGDIADHTAHISQIVETLQT